MVNQFVYTFWGGNLAEIKEPSKEVMGYVPGPGGRAVTYLDGHVKWVKN
jgi:prepilin-type processing-associated H-X9-DG protein